MAEFRHRDLQSSDPAELRRALNSELRAIEAELAVLRRRNAVSAVQTSDCGSDFGQLVRVAPPSTGLRLRLPAVVLARAGGRVTVVVEGEAGALSVEATDSTINGEDALTFAAGLGVVEFLLTADGWFAWSATMVLDLPLSAIEDQPADTFPANATSGAAPLTAHPFSTLAGLNLTYASGAINWDGFAAAENNVSLGTFRAVDFDDSSKIAVTLTDLGGGVFNVSYTLVAASVALSDLASQSADTFVGRLAGAGSPTAQALADIDSASLIYDAASHTYQVAAFTGDVAKAQNSNATTVLSASDTAAGKIEIAVQSEQETASSTTLAVTPGRQHFHPSACKFWVVATANSTTIDASYNVTSITDTAVGDMTVTIATDFSSANWCCMLSTEAIDATPDLAAEQMIAAIQGSKAVGSVAVCCNQPITPWTRQDPFKWHVAGFGDL